MPNSPKKAKKEPKSQTKNFKAKRNKKGQIWLIWPCVRPNGNPETNVKFEYLLSCYVICGRVHKNAVAAINLRLRMPEISRFVVATKAENGSNICHLATLFVANLLQDLSIEFKKCKAWREWEANLLLLCVALVSNLFVAQKLLLFLVWHSWKNMPFGLLHLQEPRFWDHRQTKLNFRNSPIINFLTVSCSRNDVLTKNLQIFKGKGVWGRFEEFKFVDPTGEAAEARFHGSIYDVKGIYVAQYW